MITARLIARGMPDASFATATNQIKIAMQIQRNHFIKVLCTLAALGFLISAGIPTAVGADQPKPGAEERIFEKWVGEWEYQGEGPETPFYPAGKFAGKDVARLALNGFFLEVDWSDKYTDGVGSAGKMMLWYDRSAKTYREINFEGDGSVSHATATVSPDGKKTVSMGKREIKGKMYDTRYTNLLSADEKTRTAKCEYSDDGKKTWKLMFELTSKKVK